MALNHNTDMLYTRSGATESNVLSAHDPLIWEFKDTALVGGPATATATVQFIVKDNDLAVIYTSAAFPAYLLPHTDIKQFTHLTATKGDPEYLVPVKRFTSIYCYNNKTYSVWMQRHSVGYDSRAMIWSYNHKTRIEGANYDLRTVSEVTGDTDFHVVPSVIVADDGHILVAQEFQRNLGDGNHNDAITIKRSDYPEDETRWIHAKAEDAGYWTFIGTWQPDNSERLAYPLFYKDYSGNIYVICRRYTSGGLHYRIYKSTNHGIDWDGGHDIAYGGVGMWLYGTNLLGGTSNTLKLVLRGWDSGLLRSQYVFYLESDDGGITWHDISNSHSKNTVVSGALTWAELTNAAYDYQVFGAADLSKEVIRAMGGTVDNIGNPYIIMREALADYSAVDYYVMFFNGTTWEKSAYIKSDIGDNAHCVLIHYSGTIFDFYFREISGVDYNLDLYRTENLASWTKKRDIKDTSGLTNKTFLKSAFTDNYKDVDYWMYTSVYGTHADYSDIFVEVLEAVKFRFDGTQILKHIIKNYLYKEISTIIAPENYGSTVDVVFRTYDDAVENANDTVPYYISQAVNQIGDEYGSNIPRLFLNDTEDIAHFLGYPTKIFFYLATDRSAHSPLIEIIDRDITESANLINSLYSFYDDWFLPSKDELNAMYVELKAHGVGDFFDLYYWSSSENDATTAWIQTFETGEQSAYSKDTSVVIRPCRSFVAGVGAYALRDVGPAGGLIFQIVGGTTYYEAAPMTQIEAEDWSNIIDVLIGTTSTAIGEGQNNTDEIIAQAGHTYSAAKFCDDWGDSGYDTFTPVGTAIDHAVNAAGTARARSDIWIDNKVGESFLIIIPDFINLGGQLPVFYLGTNITPAAAPPTPGTTKLRAVVGDNAFVLTLFDSANVFLVIENTAACNWECQPIQVIPVEDASDYGSLKLGVHCIDLGLLALSKKSIYARMYYNHDTLVKVKDYNLHIFEACENAIFIRWLNSNGDYSYWAFSPYPYRSTSGNKIGDVINNFTEMALANSQNLPLGYRDAFDKIQVIASAVPLLFRRKMLEIFTSPAVYLWNGLPSENLISSLINSTYETFQVFGLVIVSAVETGAVGHCLSDAFNINVGNSVLIIFDLNLNSGALPTVRLFDSDSGVNISANIATTEGYNQITLTATKTTNRCKLVIRNVAVSNFSTSEIIVKRKEKELDWILLNRVEGSHNLMLKKDNDNFECTLVLPENFTQQLSGQNI